VILVHHAGKSGQQRGTSQREDTLDYVIKLSRPLGYQPTEGARFIIEFEKGRDLYGEDVKIIEATMKTSPDKKTREWSFCDYLGLTENTLKEAKILRDAGQSIRQIAEITGVSKSKLQRDLKTIEDVSLPEIDVEEDTEYAEKYANSFISCMD
jgi:putative DNA primase/helicase